MLKICLLGSFEISYKNASVHISSRPAQSLFAYLALNNETAHRREKLARMLWPDSSETTARQNLRHALWRIRKTLPNTLQIEYILADDFSIAFNASSEYWLDVAILKKAELCKTADELLAVLPVYQGELLPGFYEEWVILERNYLNFRFEHNMARLLSKLEKECRWLDILEWGERWLSYGQRPEPAYRALMCAHMEKGDMPKVADTYERCVRSLEEIGLEPSEQTRNLYEILKFG
ncbi:MAG TPA: BTAD domain-containing putative transcriptional regulator [Anaerolineales bacterium]